MIKTETLIVTVTNQGKYWASLGYGFHKQGTKIEVSVNDLPRNSNKKVSVSCDKCNSDWEATYQSVVKIFDRYNEHWCKKCVRKHIHNNVVSKKQIRELGMKQKGKLHPRWNDSKTEFAAYRNRVRWMTEKTYKEYKSEINPNNFNRTINGIDGGYQLDHIISIKEGFIQGLNEKIISDKQNLQMLPWKLNRTKWQNSEDKVNGF